MRFLKSKKAMVVLLAIVVLAAWAIHLVEDEAGASLLESIEARGSRILGTRVDVSAAHIDSGRGQATISGLVVANPGGFSDNNMISAENVNVRLDAGARVIERIKLIGVAALVEFRGAKTNFEALADRIAGNAGSDEPAAGSRQSGPEAQAEDPARENAGREPVADDWRVERVEFDGIRVTIQADWTSEVIEYETDALLIEGLDAGTNDAARAVTARFIDKVLVSAAAEVEDGRLRERLMEEAAELRARVTGSNETVPE